MAARVNCMACGANTRDGARPLAADRGRHRPGVAELHRRHRAGAAHRVGEPGEAGTSSGRTIISFGAPRPSGDTAQYASVVMPTPPAATARW